MYSHSSPLQEICFKNKCFGNSSLSISDISNHSFKTREEILEDNKGKTSEKTIKDSIVEKKNLKFVEEKLQQSLIYSNLQCKIFKDDGQNDCLKVNDCKIFAKRSRMNNLGKEKFSNSNKENFPLNSSIGIKNYNELSFDISHTEINNDTQLNKELSSNLFQEFSLYNEFSSSVRDMLYELGLKPPVTNTLNFEDNKQSLDVATIPKPLPLQENVDLMNKLEKLDSSISLNSSKLKDSRKSLSYQIQENLEKERFRRKHCEHVIEELQQKLLNTEQEFALISTANEKKTKIIKELNQLLENLAVAWQKLESSQAKTQKELENECDNLKKKLNQKVEILQNTEKDLANTKENISELKFKLFEEQEKFHTEVLANENMKKTVCQLEEQLQKETAYVEELNAEIKNLQEHLKTEQFSNLQKSSEFDQLKINLQQQLLEELQKNKELETKLKKNEYNVEIINADNFALKEQLELITKEKNFAEEELRKRESEYISQEIKWKFEMEKMTNEFKIKSEEQEKYIEEQLERKYKTEIIALTSKYEKLKEEELITFQNEIQELKDNSKSQYEEAQKQLKTAEIEIASLKYKIEKIESGRSQMMSHLQSFLQSMWKNSFQVFYGTLDASESKDSSDDDNFSYPERERKNLPDELIYQSSIDEINYKLRSEIQKNYNTIPLTLNLCTDYGFCNLNANKSISNEEINKIDRDNTIIQQDSCHQIQSNICDDDCSFSSYQRKCFSTVRPKLIIDQQNLVDQTYCINCKAYAEILKNICSKCEEKAYNVYTTKCINEERGKNFNLKYKYSGYELNDDSVPSRDYNVSQQFCEEIKMSNDQLCGDNLSEEIIRKLYLKEDNNHYTQVLPAEKPNIYFQPVTKEIINIPLSKTNSTTCSTTESSQQTEDTATNNPVKFLRKKCAITTKDKVIFSKEYHNPVRDIKSIYCKQIKFDNKMKFKDMEKSNKLHPWK